MTLAMRVAQIDHHCWYGWQLSAYDLRSVGHTQVDWSKEPDGLGWVVTLVLSNFYKSIFTMLWK